jgi:septum site-determining protein MinD
MRGLFLFRIFWGGDIVARKIVITSGKGGVGKTTVTANLGRALASIGKRVVLVDVDFGLNNLDVMMGMEGKILYDITDVINGRCRLKQALVQDNYSKNLYILASGNLNTATNFNGQNMKIIVDNLSPVFDYVLIDCPAGIELGFHRAVACAEEALLVTTPNLTSLRDANKVLSVLSGYKLDSVFIVVNKVRGDLVLDKKILSPNDINSILKTDIISVLPEEDAVFLTNGYNLPSKSESNKAYKLLAKNLENNTRKLIDVTNKYSGFFGSIKKGLRRSV